MFSLVLIAIGYMLLTLYALSLRLDFYFPEELYWLSFVFAAIPLLCDLAFWHSNFTTRLIYLLAFSMLMSLQYVVIDSSNYISSYDAIFNFRLTQDITQVRWTPGMGYVFDRSFIYSFYPMANFVYLIDSFVSGINLVFVVNYFFLIRAIIVPMLLVIWFRTFLDSDISFLAATILVVSPGAVLFPHDEAIAVIFFFLAFYAITKSELTKSREYSILAIISFFALVLTHHFTTYIFIGLSACLFAAHFVSKYRVVTKPSRELFLFCNVFFGLWMVEVAWSVVESHASILADLLTYSRGTLAPSLSSPGLMSGLPASEVYIIYLGILATGLSSIGGFVLALKSRGKNSADLLVLTLLFAPLLALSFLFRFSPVPYSIDYSHRIWEFAYIAVGPLSASFFVFLLLRLKRRTLKLVTILVPLLVIIVGPLLGTLNPALYGNRLPKYISDSGLTATKWVESFGKSAEVIAYSDQDIVYPLFAGYGEIQITLDSSMFKNPASVIASNYTGSVDNYVVTHIYFTRLALLRGESPSEFHLEQFDQIPVYQRVYDNQIFTTYELTNQSHPLP